jgi:hypothetical protein
MMKLRLAAVSAAILLAASYAAPAGAASPTSLQAKAAWATMDKCTQASRVKFPDETADSLAKRDAYVHTCQRDGRVPVRVPQSSQNGSSDK